MKKKISEFPVQNHTINNIDVKVEFVEYFTPVSKFRWLARNVIDGHIGYRETVLQQLHQGSNGTQRWEDIETVYEK